MEKLQRRNHLHSSNHGFTLVGVLMVLVVLSVLGISILTITSNFVKISVGERNDQSVFYIAEAGVAEKVYDINEDVKLAFRKVKTIFDSLSIKEKETFDFVGRFYSEVVSKIDLSPQTMSSFESNFDNHPTASITVIKKNTNPPIYEIESAGSIGGKTRTVSQEFKVFLEPSLIEGPGVSGNIALYVNGTISLAGSVTINGDVNVKSSDPGNVKISGRAGIKGEVIKGVESFVKLPPFPIFPSYNTLPNQMYKDKQLVKDGSLLINESPLNGYILNMKENIEFKEILVNRNRSLIINVGNEDREIVVEHLKLEDGQGNIQIIGSGKLTIYVKDKITMNGSSKINENGDIDQLKIYQKGSSPISLSGGQKIYGSLYAEQSDISITGGGGFQGNIYTGGQNIYVGGGTSVNTQLFLAPNAIFVLGEGGHIKGSILADSFVGTGGGSLTYDDTNSGIGSGGSIKDYGDGSNLIIKTRLIEE